MPVKNSLYGYRESKKSDKYVVEMATRAQDPEIRKLAVEMLNEYHVDVRAAQDDPCNKELQKLLKRQRQAQEKEREEQDELSRGAKVVPEKGLNVDPKNIVDPKSKRLRKKPERFSDIEWTDSGQRGSTVSAEGLRACEAIALGEEETHERPITDKQRAKLDSKAARKGRPIMNDAARQLAIELLDDHDRVYTEEEGLRLSVTDLAKWWYTRLRMSKIIDRAIGSRHSSCTILSF
ncbi:unnamed protein product [Alternaria burnsii]|nr:unnamed protein product [Alternaria burnsii]